jgi:ribosomal protein S18 acetylase RimI-like enzyme
MYSIRSATREDIPALITLYQAVAKIPGGIARRIEEITTEYVTSFVEKSLHHGLIYVAEHTDKPGLYAEIHAYRSDLQVFAHILGDLTIVVHPDAQGQGLGKRIFQQLLDEVLEHHPDILRIELLTRESNKRAIALYQKLGFTIEGKLAQCIRSVDDKLEADIPMAWLRADN